MERTLDVSKMLGMDIALSRVKTVFQVRSIGQDYRATHHFGFDLLLGDGQRMTVELPKSMSRATAEQRRKDMLRAIRASR